MNQAPTIQMVGLINQTPTMNQAPTIKKPDRNYSSYASLTPGSPGLLSYAIFFKDTGNLLGLCYIIIE
jgi:hypothetical protein